MSVRPLLKHVYMVICSPLWAVCFLNTSTLYDEGDEGDAQRRTIQNYIRIVIFVAGETSHSRRKNIFSAVSLELISGAASLVILKLFYREVSRTYSFKLLLSPMSISYSFSVVFFLFFSRKLSSRFHPKLIKFSYTVRYYCHKINISRYKQNCKMKELSH